MFIASENTGQLVEWTFSCRSEFSGKAAGLLGFLTHTDLWSSALFQGLEELQVSWIQPSSLSFFLLKAEGLIDFCWKPCSVSHINA